MDDDHGWSKFASSWMNRSDEQEQGLMGRMPECHDHMDDDHGWSKFASSRMNRSDEQERLMGRMIQIDEYINK